MTTRKSAARLVCSPTPVSPPQNNAPAVAAGRQPRRKEPGRQTLQKIVAEILGVKAEDITPSARFVEDLDPG
jgi:hypothetical protein